MASNTKRCYYEVLGIERSATDGEIKTAYRKMALQWHPDKNLGNPEATAVFQLIQEANAVLSDPRERSWYDSHRDEILRGGDGQGGEEGDGEGYVVNVWPFFNGGAFSGYTDAPGGFYAVYRGVFEEVDAREREGAMHGNGGESGAAAPGFGDSASPWAEVAAFYGYWGEFVSKLSFGWADEWREQDAPSRQVRRAMEKENRKSREAARRKYQEAVRALVAFVKKRDKRVMQHQVEVQREEAERTRAKAEAAKTQAEAFRKQREEWLKEQTRQWEEEEAARREEEEAGGTVVFRLADEQSSGSDDDEDGGGYGGGGGRRRGKKKGKGGRGKGAVFECAVCNKTFKSEKQMHNHQQSRAHRKMVEELQAEFGDDVLDAVKEEEGGSDADVDVDAVEAAAAAAEGGGEGPGEGEGEGGGAPAVRDEGEAAAAALSPAPEEPSPAAEEEEEEEEIRLEGRGEEGSSEEEEEEEVVGRMARAVNRFAFGDSSSDDE